MYFSFDEPRRKEVRVIVEMYVDDLIITGATRYFRELRMFIQMSFPRRILNVNVTMSAARAVGVVLRYSKSDPNRWYRSTGRNVWSHDDKPDLHPDFGVAYPPKNEQEKVCEAVPRGSRRLHMDY